MNLAAFLSVGLGYVSGVAAALILGRRIVRGILGGFPFAAEQRRIVVRAAAAGAFIAFLPALLLGIVIGATLGGAYFQAAFTHVEDGAGDSGLVLGITLGMFAMVVLIMCLAIAAGGYIGRFIARAHHESIP
ncbi:MAG: hypothetical protein ACXWHB_02595 [Usitatibacter sp.]